jgi:hypothetical protein
MSAPALCPRCLAESRIATPAGPTCPHHALTGAAWFPAWWSSATPGESTELRRCAWLERTNKGLQSAETR